ncbi:uncharacterized protein LOC141533473 isoform X3 [Cotesia typhae]|uniref:uncharacterized protein LOC141533473 isoform X3 n=1 Tax=Cotesia typhae TaxID=2053667 RepID=UPI003D683599
MYRHQSLKLTIRNSATSVINDTNTIWASFKIPTIRPQHSLAKLEKFYAKYIKVKTHHKREKRSKAQKQNVEKFNQKLDKLFDIPNSTMVKNLPKEQQQFLNECQKGKSNLHSPVTTFLPVETFQNKSDTEQEIANEDNEKNTDEFGMKLSQHSMPASFCSLSSNSSGLKRTSSDFENKLPVPRKMKKINILTPELVSALDRTGTSDRDAMFIIAAVIESLGLDIDKYNVSYSSIRNARISKREEIVDAIKKEEIDESCVVHWDGKMLPTGQGTSKAERLSIHISGISGEKFLEAPLLSDGTGISQASAVFQALTTRNICDNIKGMCFDTTASNTGDTKGACPLLEKKIGRDLLYLACRHHTSELMLRNVAEVAWPATNGPNVPIFKRFRDNWDNIDKEVYEIGSNDEHITDILNDKKKDILDFIDNQLKIEKFYATKVTVRRCTAWSIQKFGWRKQAVQLMSDQQLMNRFVCTRNLTPQ